MTWKLGPKLPFPLWGHCSVIFRGSLVIIGGWNKATNQIGHLSSMRSVHALDGDKWNRMPYLRYGRSTHGCTVTKYLVNIIFIFLNSVL